MRAGAAFGFPEQTPQERIASFLGRLRDVAPDTIYQFHPGGAGIKFAQRYANLGVKPQMPMFLPVFSMDLRKI